MKMTTFLRVEICPFSFCSTSTAFAQKMIIKWILVGAFAYVLLILLYVYCFFTKNKHLQFRNIEIINIIHENHGKWCAVTFNVAQLFIFLLFFKRFLNSAQHTFWVPPKGPELLSFTKCNKNQWKHSKTFNCWPSKWRTYQYSTGFRLFLKLARSMISIPSKASKMTNLYGSQNAIKTNDMLQKPTNMKSKHGETLNIPHVLYCVSNSDKSRFVGVAQTLQNKWKSTNMTI